MRVDYHADTDSLYIDLSERPSAESLEVSDGIVLSYDGQGCLVGIEVGNASKSVQLNRLVLSKLSAKIETISG